MWQFDCRPTLTAGNIYRVTRLQPHGDFTRLSHTPVGNQGVNAIQPRSTFAHRPCRQPPAIAKAANAIDHHQFKITL
ncbi:hypothetical protein D3C76_1802320 [compost metagenome]